MMNIIQSGMAKSGNYWVWKILDLTLKASFGEPSKYIVKHKEFQNLKNKRFTHEDQLYTDVLDVDMSGYYLRVGPYFKEKIYDIEDYTNNAQHIWTHSEYHPKFEKILRNTQKTIYIIRHPAKVAISQANFAFTPYILEGTPHHEKNAQEYLQNRLEWSLYSWRQNVTGWLSNMPKNSYILFYENLKSDFDSEYLKLLNYLEISLPKEKYQVIKDSVTAKHMNKNNPDHVRKTRGNLFLRKKDQKMINDIAGPVLDKLNYSNDKKIFLYPNEHNSNEFKSLHRNSKISISQLPKAIFHLIISRRKFGDKLKISIKKAKIILSHWINLRN